MKQRMLAYAVLLVLIATTVFARGAQEPGGAQNQQAPPAPAPQPTPQPQQRQPAPTQAGPSQNLAIRGRIITDARGSYSMIEVRFETDGGQPVGFAFADSNGEFTFQRTGFSGDQTLYVIVNLEGFKPYRERIGGVFGMSTFDGLITIFLERETIVKEARGGAPVVDLKQSRAKIPGKAVDEYEKGLSESSKGNASKAVERLERAIKLAPDFYEAQATLGVQYLRLQKFQDAEAALIRARDLSPKSAEPLMNLGTLYYQQGELQSDAGHPDEAVSTFQKAAGVLEESVRRNPLLAAAHSYLGAALYKTASYDRAESTLNRALELDGGLQNARLMLINVYSRQQRFKEALEQINTYLTKNPKSPQRPALEGIKQQIEKVLAKKN